MQSHAPFYVRCQGDYTTNCFNFRTCMALRIHSAVSMISELLQKSDGNTQVTFEYTL